MSSHEEKCALCRDTPLPVPLVSLRLPWAEKECCLGYLVQRLSTRFPSRPKTTGMLLQKQEQDSGLPGHIQLKKVRRSGVFHHKHQEKSGIINHKIMNSQDFRASRTWVSHEQPGITRKVTCCFRNPKLHASY